MPMHITMKERDDLALQVGTLRRQNVSVREMSLFLGIPQRRIFRLLVRFRELMRIVSRNVDGEFHLGETLSVFIDMERQAREKFERLDPDSNVAVGYLNTAMKARMEIKKLLQECGAMLKVPEVVEEGIPFDDPEIRKDYLLLRARAIARKRGKEAGGEG